MSYILTSYIDYVGANLNTQMKLAQELKLDTIVIRKIEGSSFFDVKLNGNEMRKQFRRKKILFFDPELRGLESELEAATYLQKLNEAASFAKSLKAQYLVYEIPLFDDLLSQQEKVIHQIKTHVDLIKKYKLDILIKPGYRHLAQTYRYILEALKDVNVKMMFDPVHLYQVDDALMTAFRLLYPYVAVLRVDDCDPLLKPRMITTGKFIDLDDLFIQFKKKHFEGAIVLDSGMIELIHPLKKHKWYQKLLNKEVRHEMKIRHDFDAQYASKDVKDIIDIQLTVIKQIFS